MFKKVDDIIHLYPTGYSGRRLRPVAQQTDPPLAGNRRQTINNHTNAKTIRLQPATVQADALKP